MTQKHLASRLLIVQGNMENQGMGFNKLSVLTLLIMTTGCGYASKEVYREGGVKTSNKLEFKIPLTNEPPPIQTEEIRKTDPDYKPSTYLSLPPGAIVTFREKFEIDSKDPRVTKVLESNRVGMYFKFPKKLEGKTINLKGLELKVTEKQKSESGDVYPDALLLTFRDPTVTGDEERIDLPIVCKYYGEYIDAKNMVSYQAHLSRDCTIEEFIDTILNSSGLVLDYVDTP